VPDLEIPPPSRSTEQFRAEVGRRAAHLGRRRALRSGSAVAVVAVVAAVVLVATLVTGSATRHRSASTATHATTVHPATAPSTTAHPDGSSGQAGDSEAPPSGSASAAAPQLHSGGTSIPPEFSLDGPSDLVTVDRRPSGVVVRAETGQTVLVLLPSTPGGWGGATAGVSGGGVLSVVAPAHAGTSAQIVLRAVAPGTATVTVRRAAAAAGKEPSVWHGTIVVQKAPGFRCPAGTTVCRRPLGAGTPPSRG